ncbi:MAG: asparagine--tRNA ligase [Gammaproteobacteria bacterium]|nr:asparagine--tRNA ligase [Gammaproteobacteria bacterium]
MTGRVAAGAPRPRSIADLLKRDSPLNDVEVQGWIRTRRDSREFSFLEVNDGSCLGNVQVLVDAALPDYGRVHDIHTGAAVRVVGDLVESPGKGQRWEVRARSLELIGPAPEDYPLQKKRHTDEYLRTIAHLRPRTNKYGAMFRIRSSLAHAVHRYLGDHGFFWIHTPIITGSDCEGAGEMFRVTALDLDELPRADGAVDYSKDFFGREANLTVSGQLSLETLCLSLGKVYSFGPTFRSENSNTARHMAEFWMIEPEAAFADLRDIMALGEDMIRHLVRYVMEHCSEDLDLFARFVDKNLMATLSNIAGHEFIRVPYSEAVTLLENAGRAFEYAPAWGRDLQTEHERFLTEQYFKQPVIVYDYPKELKPFYMRRNDDGRTVAAMDVLVPSIGEIIGGSQREERLEQLQDRIAELGLDARDYWWYLDTRRFGSAPHAGFGLGFERLLMLVTGVPNIRDVIPFPRTPNHLEF